MELIEAFVLGLVAFNFLLFIVLVYVFAKVHILSAMMEEMLRKKQDQQQGEYPPGYRPLIRNKGPMSPKDVPPGF